NREHGIEPKTIYKTYEEIMSSTLIADSKGRYDASSKDGAGRKSSLSILTAPVENKIGSNQRKELLDQLRKEMINAAKDLEFERAAELRDEIERLAGK